LTIRDLAQNPKTVRLPYLEKPDEPLCAGTHGPEKTGRNFHFICSKKYSNTENIITVNLSGRFVGSCELSSMENHERMGLLL
jgi:hypothetical protein